MSADEGRADTVPRRDPGLLAKFRNMRPKSSVFVKAPLSTLVAATSVKVDYVKFRADQPLHSWDDAAQQFGHLWYPQEGRKSDICSRCKHKFSRMNNDGFKCAACHKRIHTKCTDVADTSACRPSFEKVSPPHFEPEHATIHHWVAGIFEQVKSCDVCKKSVRAIMGSTVSLRCAWCKRTIHKSCFEGKADAWGECDLGALARFILPSTAILMCLADSEGSESSSVDDISAVAVDGSAQMRALDLRVSARVAANMDGANPPIFQRSGSMRSIRSLDSLESDMGNQDYGSIDASKLMKTQRQQLHSLRKGSVSSRKDVVMSSNPQSRFIIVPPLDTTPLLVFINPSSGGNQGAKLISHFQWVLNPRQIFNLMARSDSADKPVGPRAGLEIYKDVPNLRILVCGGDGTVGWVLETLDQMGLSQKNIPVGTLPLGTGNDLARCLKFGGGYAEGTSVQKLLLRFMEAVPIKMDRWSIEADVNEASPPSGEDEEKIEVTHKLPQSVFNNYFSIGSDAYTALKFHLARQANPHKFDSRIRNKFEYAIVGGKDLIRHRFKNLSQEIELICDGVDHTELLKRKQVEAIALINISSYAAGTNPWGTKNATEGFAPPRMDDGKLEVVGFCSSWDFPKGQLGLGHALRICQAQEICIRSRKPLPMQVDGEPCMMAPSNINIKLKNQATMLGRAKGRFKKSSQKLEVPTAVRADAITDEDSDFEEGSSSASHFFQATSDDDNQSEDDILSTHRSSLTIYLVPMDENARAGGLRPLGDTELSLDLTLAQARAKLSALLNVPFDFDAGWRYLQYKQSSEERPGTYYVLTRREEESTFVSRFVKPLEKIKPGLFVTQLPSDSKKESPAAQFFAAAVKGSIEEMAHMLDAGVAVHVTDAAGQTAMHLAARHNRLGVMLALLRCKLDPNIADAYGRTALHCAAESGHRSAVDILIEAGALPYYTDKYGQRPQDLAMHAHQEIYTLLASMQDGTETSRYPDMETVV